MRGIARLGIDEAHVRALHAIRSYASDVAACQPGKPPRCGTLHYRSGSSTRASYFVRPQLTVMTLDGAAIRTPERVKTRSTTAQLRDAYPTVRCKSRLGTYEYCYLLRGTVTGGVLTQFIFYSDRLVEVALHACAATGSNCRTLLGP